MSPLRSLGISGCLVLFVLTTVASAHGAGAGESNVKSEAAAWAFTKPVAHPLPVVSNTRWPQRPLDYFVLAAMEQRRLHPVSPAPRRELIRRVSLDLIGLPPTPEESDAFERDTDPDAYVRWVDRLLASPHYGERWARYWLDVARYADDQGNSFLTPTPSAYLYRDWVVDALNRDLPYDEFVRLQIAGDEIPGEASDYVARLAGLGFQGLGPQFRKGAAGEAKAKADELEDRIDTMTRGILGLTVSCARCHDHKFDPIPTRDYYSLAAAYNGAEWPNRMLAAPAIVDAHRRWGEDVEKKKAEIKSWTEAEARRLGREAMSKVEGYVLSAVRMMVARYQKLPLDEAGFAKQEGLDLYFLNRWIQRLEVASDDSTLKAFKEAIQAAKTSGVLVPDERLRVLAAGLQERAKNALETQGRIEAASKDPAAKPTPVPAEMEQVLKLLMKDGKAPFLVSEADCPALLEAGKKVELASMTARLDQLTKNPPPSGPLMPSVQGGGKSMKVFVRGNPEVLGEEAPPGFLRALGPGRTDSPGKSADKATTKAFTRLDLANALVSPENPLTARVLVNRVWHYHFGRGIVATLSNFGKLGSAPTHPELLDTLAARFMESGWSLKALHREILLSATYQQSCIADADNMAVDAGNEYLWRMTPRRLDFEAWRDSLLSVAGGMNLAIGGASVDQANPGLKEVAGFNFFTRLNGVEVDNPGGRRRTLYSVVSRYTPNATLTLFDFPEPNVTSDQRTTTTVPQQQLFVLNSPFFLEVSQRFARRLEAKGLGTLETIRLGWKLAYGRGPTVEEERVALEFVGDAARRSEPSGFGRWEQLCHALLASNELMFCP